MLYAACRTQRILQIRVHLHLLREFGCFDFDKGRWYSFHVWPIRIECHTARTNRIFVFVGVNACRWQTDIHKPQNCSQQSFIVYVYFHQNYSIRQIPKNAKYLHRRHRQTDRSWFWPSHRPSIYRAMHRRTQFWLDPVSAMSESRSWSRQLSMEWLPPSNTNEKNPNNLLRKGKQWLFREKSTLS